MSEEPLLHLYAQSTWHERAYIVGTPQALRVLADMLARVLSESPPVRTEAEVCASDGEGYTMEVRCLGEQDIAAHYAVPYTDASAREDSRLWPLSEKKPPQLRKQDGYYEPHHP